MNPTSAQSNFDSHSALRVLAFGMAFGFVAIYLYGFHKVSEFITVAIVGSLLAGASLLVGGAIGFLFGIPRTLQHEENLGDSDKNTAANQTPAFKYRVNTNLEQISDWLTKILVGVGLTQLNSIPVKLQEITRYVAKGIGDSASDQIFALSVLLFFVVSGFLFGYLWTRLFLVGALRHADQSAIGALTSSLEQFKKQSELDVEALNLTDRQLNLSSDLPKIPQEELNTAIASASQQIKVQIFNKAWQVRSSTWRYEETKNKMERTIPIFKALIHNDPEERYHMNHGQLGFALKDKTVPEWAEAENELTKAITIRGKWETNGWLLYEFNRAICRIMQDRAFKEGKPSEAKTRLLILSDLQAAAEADLFRRSEIEANILRWMTINNINKNDIETKVKHDV